MHRRLLTLLLLAPGSAFALTNGERPLDTAPVILLGAQPDEQFGASLAVPGDLDGDGFADLLIGAPLADDGAGRVYLYSGAELAVPGTVPSNAAALVLRGPEAGGFGFRVESLGDVDGDGLPDVGVGAPRAPGGDAPAGRLYVFSGRALRTALQGTPIELGDALVAVDGPNGGAWFGEGFAGVGDTDGDGLDDIAAIARDESVLEDRAVLFVIRGRGVGLWPTTNLLSGFASWSTTYEGPGLAADGYTVADTLVGVGDADGDGTDDIALGAPGESGDVDEGGAVYLLSGAAEDGAQLDATVDALARVAASASLLGAPNAVGARFGQPLARTGREAGSWLWVGHAGPERGGAVALAVGPALGGAADRRVRTVEGFPGSVRIGAADLYGDGVERLVAAHPRDGEVGATVGGGATYVLPIAAEGDLDLGAADAAFVGPEAASSGTAMRTANLDGDAYDDLVVSAPLAHVSGAVYLLLGEYLGDADGFAPLEGDCNDAIATVRPDGDEATSCDDGLDNDCDGLVDDADEPCRLAGSGFVVACATGGGGSPAPWAFGLLLLAVARFRRPGLALLLAGCTSGGVRPEPTIRLVDPADGDRVQGFVLPVTVEVGGARLSPELAGQTVDMTVLPAGMPEPVLWKLTVDGVERGVSGGITQIVEGLEPGSHTVIAELVDLLGGPLEPARVAESRVELIAGNPELTITAPSDGALLPPSPFEVSYDVTGFVLSAASIGRPNQLGVGHAHVRVDGALVAESASGAELLDALPAGLHTITVELAGNDHEPLDPPVSTSVGIDVQPPIVTITAPADGSTVDGPAIDVAYTLQNYAFDPDVGAAGQPGRGHTHVYLDGIYQGLDTAGSLTLPYTNGCEHTLRIEIADSSHLEIGFADEVSFSYRPCVTISDPVGGGTVSLGPVTVAYETPSWPASGSTLGTHVHLYVDGSYQFDDSDGGSIIVPVLTPGPHTIELRLADGAIGTHSGPAPENDELAPIASTRIAVTAQ